MDYNIYIHTDGYEAPNGSKTTPWGMDIQNDSPTSAWKTNAEKLSKVNLNPLESVRQLVSKGVNALVQAVPQIALAYAVVKLGEKAVKLADTTIETAIPFYETETGDFTLGMQYHNMKNVVNALTHPFSTGLNIAREYRQNVRANERRAMSRELLGDSIINTYTNRGV